MRSGEYRDILRKIVKNAIRKRFPGVNKVAIDECSRDIATVAHARLYGANVDGVDSPLYRELNSENKTADDIMKEQNQ